MKIQYNRNRYYDYYTARWTTHDPLGYVDGMSLYEYVISSPKSWLDAFGLGCCPHKCVAGKTKYVLLDFVITPYHVGPGYKGAMRATKAVTTGATIGQILLALKGVWHAADPMMIPNYLIVKTIFKTLKKLEKKFEEVGYESYLKVQKMKCKKEWCCIIMRRYNWKKDGRSRYYQCYAGSYVDSGLYEEPGDAIDNADKCMDAFESKYETVLEGK